ncbi:MAG TPA: DUF4870 domain-containing protein [Abditibacteriaceae bacterium]|nr:DUF4870 domain-containing protein [Abditibacteriaceae bacterium]
MNYFPSPSDQNAPNQTPGNAPNLTSEEKQWGMACHLSALAGLFLPTLGHVLGPLVVWLLKKDSSPFVDAQGKESLNFQLSISLYALLVSPSVFILIGFFLLGGLAFLSVLFAIIGAMRASNGESYRYPMTIRFLK